MCGTHSIPRIAMICRECAVVMPVDADIIDIMQADTEQ
jgi:hypothetical protein